MAHIAIDSRVINSGTGTYVVKLLNYLQQIDKVNKYSVLVRAKDRDYWQPSSNNFEVIVADFDNYSLAEQMGFKKFLDRLNPDLVHFCMPQQPLLYKGRRVTTMHDMTLLNTYNSDKNWLVFRFKQLIGRFAWKRVAKISDHVIAISENTKREYQEFSNISDDKISVIYEAAEALTTNQLKPYRHPFKQFILYVGQQPDYKNIRRLGDAHQKLLGSHPDLGLILVGRIGKDSERNKRYFKNKNYKNIIFTGFISDAERDYLYTKATAYVFPSLMEGFGLPPLEAMAYGLPVISSNSSCMPEILGDAPVYFNPTNTDDMVSKINQVISSDDLRKQMIARGHAQVGKYSWQRMAEETHEIYMKILSN